jgi:Domain of unknown function (DUF4159)
MDVPAQEGTGVMTRRLPLALALTAVVALLAIDTLSAQRGGWYDLSQYRGNVRYDGKLVFVRMSYPIETRRNQPWAHDYPDGERHFMRILTGVSNVPAHVEESSIMSFGDPEMFKFPVIYLCEPGYWFLSEQEAAQLRAYLLKGGFLIVDDFGRQYWGNFEVQMTKVFPDGEWKELTAEHRIFHTFFEIPSFDIIPLAYFLGGPPTFLGMFEDNDEKKRMYVMVNYQQDISEFWEASGQGINLVDPDNQAFKLGVNEFLYGLLR